jgi:hypothetical protein
MCKRGGSAGELGARDRPAEFIDPYDDDPTVLSRYGITPEMLAAGAEIIGAQFGEIVTFDLSLGRYVAKAVFVAMMNRRF